MHTFRRETFKLPFFFEIRIVARTWKFLRVSETVPGIGRMPNKDFMGIPMEHYPPCLNSTSRMAMAFLCAGCYISAADQQGLLVLGFSSCHEVQVGRTTWRRRRPVQRSFQSIDRLRYQGWWQLAGIAMVLCEFKHCLFSSIPEMKIQTPHAVNHQDFTQAEGPFSQNYFRAGQCLSSVLDRFGRFLAHTNKHNSSSHCIAFRCVALPHLPAHTHRFARFFTCGFPKTRGCFETKLK